WSQTRRYVNTGRPEYSGRIAWRAIMPITAGPDGIARHTVTLWLAPNSHLVTYPIANGTYFNAVAITQGGWQDEGWSTPGEIADLALAFSNWNLPVQTMIQTTEGWLKWALCAIDPNLSWTKDRVALLGDAAHAMVPFMAQGAGMSIEDAWTLTHYVSRSSAKDLPDALSQYQKSRQDRVTKVWETSMQQGKIYHMSGIMRAVRNLAMQVGGPVTANRYNWIYDWRP
ncbi:MAG: FAD-dependent monooxygenase, partial [Hyphomicrobiales bacterium]